MVKEGRRERGESQAGGESRGQTARPEKTHPVCAGGWAWHTTGRQEGEDIVQCDRARGAVQGQL